MTPTSLPLRPIAFLALLCAAAILLASSLLPAQSHPATQPATAPRLAPGALFTIPFPEMPKTYTGQPAQMTVFLPTNYDPARKFPLLIFLQGGTGGNGDNPVIARALCEDKDFVCVSLPLFKDPVTPEKNLIRASDCKFGWPFHKTMLAQLEKSVPNLDPDHRILGGFSNGAHATAGLLDASDGHIARTFSAFFCIEGGGKLEHYDLLQGKAFLMVYGSEQSRPRATEIFNAAQAAGAAATLAGMNHVGHAFPASEYPIVRKWLYETLTPVAPRPATQPAP